MDLPEIMTPAGRLTRAFLNLPIDARNAI